MRILVQKLTRSVTEPAVAAAALYRELAASALSLIAPRREGR